MVSEFIKRRQKIASLLPANSLLIIPAAKEVIRSGDTHYRFRQDSDFYYLTGFNEPQAILIILAKSAQTILFTRPRNLETEQWTGRILGPEDAKIELKVDEAYPIFEFDSLLPEILADKDIIYLPLDKRAFLQQRILKAWQKIKGLQRSGIKAPEIFADLSPVIGNMRLYKSQAEISLMKKAASISIDAHLRAMRKLKHLNFEYELEAELIYEITRQAAVNFAYDPIVASADNACILHYSKNNEPIVKDKLILIDAGAEWKNYAADITRTMPANGKFNAVQRDIYELVLQAQQKAIKLIKPGLHFDKMQLIIVKTITNGLIDLGLLKGNVEDLIATGAYKKFYMHSSGHWLGLDTHDVGDYKINNKWRKLEEGMVLTVEPGIYICAESKVHKKWQGIGVRIEDDIVVTKDGCVNLTEKLPVLVQDIEAVICD